MVDNKHLFIRNFRYEKTGPGKEGYRQVEKSVSVIPFFKIGEVVFGTGM